MLSVIILTRNSRKYLDRCFDAVINKCASEGIEYEIIVIDNGSSDGSHSVLDHFVHSKPDNFRLVLLETNKGTTYPRNLGLKMAQGEYICILDSDTELLSGELTEVLRLLDQRREVGIVAPRLLLGNGSVQNSVKKFPTFWHKLIKIPKILFRIKGINADFYSCFPFEKETEVDSAISACWFFRRDLLETVGMLDESIFYSPEDLDYCMRVHKAGKKILYCPFFTVMHFTQQISHKKPFSKVSLSHFRGLFYYFRKHGGWIFPPNNKVR